MTTNFKYLYGKGKKNHGNILMVFLCAIRHKIK